MLRNGVPQRFFVLNHLPLYLHRPPQPPRKKMKKKGKVNLPLIK